MRIDIHNLAYIAWWAVLVSVMILGAMTFVAFCAVITAAIHPMVGCILGVVMLVCCFLSDFDC